MYSMCLKIVYARASLGQGGGGYHARKLSVIPKEVQAATQPRADRADGALRSKDR